MIHGLWRCRCCGAVVEVVECGDEKLIYQNRETKDNNETYKKIFVIEFDELDCDDVLIETGGIF